MKKTLLALTALSTLTSISLSARELLCEQCIPEDCCFEHLFVERSEIRFNAAFLYWTTNEGVLDYAIKTGPTPIAPDTFAIGKYQTTDYDWRPGYRLALSYYKCHRYWELTGEYTWLFDAGSDHTHAPLNPTRETGSASPFEHARSTINLHYHVGDLYAARVFDPNPHLRMKVLAGLTVGVLEQHWKNIYTNFDTDFDRVKEDWRFCGGGIRFGSTFDWFWGCNFYLTGKLTIAGLIGSYKNTTFQNHADAIIGNAKYDDNRFAMHTQFLLGPSWQMPCDCWSMEIFAGYEMNLWFNLHERIRTEFNSPDATKPTHYADSVLGLQGLTLRFTVGF